MLNPEGFVIKSEEDIGQITHTSEQQFARALLTNPNLEITHETDIFWADAIRITSEGELVPVTVGHLPDFKVVNRNNPSVGPIFVEITQVPYNPQVDPPEEDPKAKQKHVMKQVGNTRHVVLYKANLEAVTTATGIPIIDESYTGTPSSSKEPEKKYIFP